MSQLLSQYISDAGIDQNSTSITIEILAGQSVNIADDLSISGHAQKEIRFIVHEHASLVYRSSLSNKNNECIERINGTKRIALILAGRHARADFNAQGLFAGSDRALLQVTQEHRASDTRSNVVIRGVCNDTAKFAVETLIRVEKDIHAVHAEQVHKQLLVSERARVSSQPQLEVLSDDVVCMHGAAIKHVDDEQIFYIQSRGLSRSEAESLVVESFLADDQ